MNTVPLAERIRPKSYDDIVGQDRLFGKNGIIRRMTEAGRIGNMIFYGPPGTGKTTAANVIANESGMTMRYINATSASTQDVRDAISSSTGLFGMNGVLLYIDEIQYFNRRQQQTILQYIEDGRVTLIASTTENPHMYIYNAVISRSALFEFQPVKPEAIVPRLSYALSIMNEEGGKGEVIAKEETLKKLAVACSGDVRRGITVIENAYYAAEGGEITEDVLNLLIPGISNFNDDTYYDLLSALQKSIRGSDPDASVYYLARILETGDILSAVRRLLVIAAEDIGLAYPMAAAVVYALCHSATELGLPEARIPLSEAVLLLATSPKSNSAEAAIDAASADIADGHVYPPPTPLRSPLYEGYKYPHEYPGHYVAQQYLPDRLRTKKYYTFGDNKHEQAAKAYFEAIKGIEKGNK